MSDKKALGRGLSALLSDVDLGQNLDEPRDTDRPIARQPDTSVAIELLHANPDQPRQAFPLADQADLAQSIRQHGIIQPLVVRPHPQRAGEYQIVAGERRWRAAQEARLHEVPVVIRDLADTEVLQIAIVENIQRADLGPLEEARGFRALMENFGHTQEKLAEALGKSRSHIANALRLLTLPERVAALVADGRLTAGHARACLAAADPVKLAQAIIDSDLSVRQAEDLAKKSHHPGQQRLAGAKHQKDPDTAALERDLSAAIGFRVSIEHASGGPNGSLRIHYRTLDDLDALIVRLNRTLIDEPRQYGIEDQLA